DLSHLRKHTREATAELDKSFNKSFGSLFRSGSKQSFFSMQARTLLFAVPTDVHHIPCVQRYADLYTADYTNLLNYPLFYTFYAPPFYLSHEREHVLF
ncbi:5'-nucleotidase, partial [Acanthamoeba castellanii str. Neff]